MREDCRIPITILTSFLGLGKTMLLNGLLRTAKLADSAVIINKFIGAARNGKSSEGVN